MGGVSELRHRHPGDAVGPEPNASQPGDSDHRRAARDVRRPASDGAVTGTGMARDRPGGYDADARFKCAVPKPEGYLPGDTMGSAAALAAVRRIADAWRGARSDPDRVTDLRSRRDPAQAPRLREGVDGDGRDALRALVNRPDFDDPRDEHRPDRYGEPLTRPDGSTVPCLDGPPRRDQTRQGWPGDCGIIAALGAIAAHHSEQIARRIQPQQDGSYRVRLNETERHGGVAEPTGRDIELTVTPGLPVYDRDPSKPAGAKTEDGASWCAVFEKAFAGIDQTWSPGRWASWERDWAGLCADDSARKVESPRSGPAPTGYIRLHQGTTAWERAEALTQLTGRPAAAREFPTGRDEWTINRLIRAQLDDGKPVLVSSRPKEHEREVLPHGLKASHVYEVTGIEKGRIHLRNPWNKDHPEAMETDEFARNMSPYYSTLI
jgi:hypothetical protein